MTLITGMQQFFAAWPTIYIYYIKESGFVIIKKNTHSKRQRRKQGDWVSLESLQKYLERARDKD